MDYATFKSSTDKIDEAKKVYNKALVKEQKTREAHDEAKRELKKAEEGYVKALEDAQAIVSPQRAKSAVDTPVE